MLDKDKNPSPTKEEWDFFFKECKDMIRINYRKLAIPREDLARNEWVVDDTLSHLLWQIGKKVNTYNQEKATFKTWINGFVKFIVLEFSNAKYPFEKDEITETELGLEYDIFDFLQNTSPETPEDKLKFDMYINELRLALEQLPTNWYRVLYMRIFEELSVEETANRLNITKKRVYNITNKGRERLKEILIDMGWDFLLSDREAN